jgi:ATP-dependent 26S proteasome regulatory subunit
MSIQTRLENYFKAAFPCISLETPEERRAFVDILCATKSIKGSLVTWSATEGARLVLEKGIILPEAKVFDDTQDLLPAMRVNIENTVYVLKDAGPFPFDRDPVLGRAFFDLLNDAPQKGNTIILLGPNFKLWPAVEKLVTIIQYDLPNKTDLLNIATGIVNSIGKKIDVSNDVINALSGLSVTEAENALSLSYIETKNFVPSVIYREKVAAVKRSGLLDLIDTEKMSLDSVGGLDELKKWILKRKNAFSEKATQFKLPTPKGILLVGIPGSGKSLSAKAIGSALGVPTLRLDIGSLFNSLVGESERRCRDALALAQALSPCVLWIDEVEKGLSGSSGTGSSDGGTTKRVFGTILSWLQEQKGVFLVATANDVSSLPPEFYRKGRFDEIFALDLPNDTDRKAIFNVVCKKYNRRLTSFDTTVIEKMEGFTGSEIEAVFIEALYMAFDASREVTSQDIVDCCKNITPLSVMAKEKMDIIHNWAKNNARNASSVYIKQGVTERRIKCP